MFKGSFVALATPFKDGAVDEKKLTELVEWHIDQGTDGLVPMGTTGESPTVSHDEHERVIEIVVKAAKKRVPVLAGAGSNSTKEAVNLSREAEKSGADGLLSVNPYYNKPSQDGLKAHFGAIADSVRIPVILYNIPSRTNVCLSPQTIEDLAKGHSNIVGVKEATGSMDQASEIINRLPNFIVLSGDDSLTFPLMALGAKGVISVAANIVPKAVHDLCSAALNGKMETARALHAKLFPLCKALFIETNPAPVKAAMADLGLIDSSEVRLPLVSIKPENLEKVRAALKAFGVSSQVGAR